MHPSEELPEQETAVGGTCGGESSSLLRAEDDISRARSATSREPDSFFVFSHKHTVRQNISSRGKGNHLLGLQWERALAAVDQSFLKKAPHDANVYPRQS
ncbi:hypothetical protein E2C01_078837 [Portunus trituberculatus]|uniref:Uncharacterized protein n=1 Tax=Portunus trituberculatus TaxID=210409 RepID=A0A5B7IHW0_PORTR|nr:hypothetical protein [Portunus trituberculatus]